jgi:hypothetical protein
MRSRLLLVIAVALTVASGWHGERADRITNGAQDATALRTLADHGLIGEPAAELTDQPGGRHAKPYRTGEPFESTAPPVGAWAIAAAWTLAAATQRCLRLDRFRRPFTRAPPSLLPA